MYIYDIYAIFLHIKEIKQRISDSVTLFKKKSEAGLSWNTQYAEVCYQLLALIQNFKVSPICLLLEGCKVQQLLTFQLLFNLQTPSSLASPMWRLHSSKEQEIQQGL